MHMMVDLETLDTTATSYIASIGAVMFDPNSDVIGPSLYTVVDLNVPQPGRTISSSTVKWWLKQSDSARSELTGQETKFSVRQALDALASFMAIQAAQTGWKVDGVWGNGSDFDNAILIDAFHKENMQCPWSFGRNRCFRTIKNMLLPKEVVMPERAGTHHNALDDALHQVKVLQAITKATGIRF